MAEENGIKMTEEQAEELSKEDILKLNKLVKNIHKPFYFIYVY